MHTPDVKRQALAIRVLLDANPKATRYFLGFRSRNKQGHVPTLSQSRDGIASTLPYAVFEANNNMPVSVIETRLVVAWGELLTRLGTAKPTAKPRRAHAWRNPKKETPCA